MISFRFHLVSLVAVFLALGLGVLTGTTVLNRGIVAQLERQTDDLVRQSNELREQVARLEGEIATWTGFGREVRDMLVTDRLLQTDAVLVTQDGTDPAAVDAAREALAMAGTRLRLVVSVDARMSLAEEGDREALADVLDLGAASDAEELRSSVADALADQLAFGPSGTDVVEVLAREGFAAVERPDPPPEERAAVADRVVVVVVGGGEAEGPLPPAEFLVPLVERLVLDGQAVAASEARVVTEPFVPLLRDGDLADRLVTQDNVDDIPGEISLVLAIEDMLELGEHGHYGVKPGAGQLMPALP